MSPCWQFNLILSSYWLAAYFRTNTKQFDVSLTDLYLSAEPSSLTETVDAKNKKNQLRTEIIHKSIISQNPSILETNYVIVCFKVNCRYLLY